jgi:hypothetical protein
MQINLANDHTGLTTNLPETADVIEAAPVPEGPQTIAYLRPEGD